MIKNLVNEEEPYRFIILILFMLATILMATLSVSFVSISDMLPEIYKVSKWTLFYINMVYNIMFIPGNFVGNYIFDKFGIKKGIQIAITLTILGAFLRIFINQSFYYVVLGK